MKNMSKTFWMGMILATFAATVAVADILPITITETAGMGSCSAFVAINFADGAKYNFQVNFDGTPTGEEILNTLDTETGLDVYFSDFGWGRFVDGFAYDGHSNIGYTGGENWFHYWVADSVNPSGWPNWTSPSYGASARTITNGDWDGWVYGSAASPVVPEPATLGLAALGILFLRNRRGNVK